MGKWTWILGILGIIIVGVVVYWLTEGRDQQTTAAHNYQPPPISSPVGHLPPTEPLTSPARTTKQPTWEEYRQRMAQSCDKLKTMGIEQVHPSQVSTAIALCKNDGERYKQIADLGEKEDLFREEWTQRCDEIKKRVTEGGDLSGLQKSIEQCETYVRDDRYTMRFQRWPLGLEGMPPKAAPTPK